MLKLIVPFSFFLIAVLLFLLSLSGGPPPRSDWQAVTGVPTQADVSTVRGRYGRSTDFLTYYIGDYGFQHASDEQGYAEVVQSVDRREITVMTTPRKIHGGSLGENSIARVWEIKIGDRVVMPALVKADEDAEGKFAMRMVAGGLLFAGVMGLVGYVRASKTESDGTG